VKDSQHIDLSGDIYDEAPYGNGVSTEGLDLRLPLNASGSLMKPEKDPSLKYCVIASLVVHLLLLVYLTRVSDLTPTKALLRPGEKVTSVRLIEPPQEPKVPEPPPKEASAISDRDHTAVKERKPKAFPDPKPPLGKVEPLDKRMASLVPPPAPEDLVKPQESQKKKDDAQKQAPEEKRPEGKGKPKASTDPKQKHNNREKEVDLRPTPQEIAKGLSSGAGSSEFFPDGDAEEAVVDINTREEKFFSYLLHLKRKIQAVWVYPQVASKTGMGGMLTVEFSIARNGELLYVNLMDSSGHPVLDEYALRAIKTAAPYYPFPDRMKAKRLRVRANFIYVTSNFFRSIM